MENKVGLIKFSIRLILAGLLLIGLSWLWSWGYEKKLMAASIEKATVQSFTEELENIKDSDISLTTDGQVEFKISSNDLNSFIEEYVREYTSSRDLRIVHSKLNEYLVDLATRANRIPINARIRFENGRAVEFSKSSPGRTMNIEETRNNIAMAMLSGNNTAEIVFQYSEPEITLEKINQLGITNLIGRGESDFTGSSQSRIHNIRLGASKYNGVVIAPNEEFSFNEILGEVSENVGFQSELVIKNGKLEKEAGGGICQVSTTLFRAAIYSGLPILERKAHSFAVRYYNPQGFDSTIYPGVVDLKFRNDTPGHILLQSYITGNKIAFEIYGTDAGRKVSIEGPVQYDIEPSGAMKAYFVRKVTQDGETKETRFSSVYKAPPSAQERNPLE